MSSDPSLFLDLALGLIMYLLQLGLPCLLLGVSLTVSLHEHMSIRSWIWWDTCLHVWVEDISSGCSTNTSNRWLSKEWDMLRMCSKYPILCEQVSGKPMNCQTTIDQLIGGMDIGTHTQRWQIQLVTSELP